MATGFTDSSKNDGLTAIAAAGTWVSLHSDDPLLTGANELSTGAYARVQAAWGTASAGSITAPGVTINVPAGITIKFWGLWSAGTVGTFKSGKALPANETYGGAGTYVLTPTLTATG